ncbi:C4-dicarboxylate transport transcriptional regulatory protein DctD [Aliiroseovarius sp. xm-m-379]|uniref:sigma-54-dependent transcriptional regulator n=1 Tax=unclassified Aliiroseovarius TaxID=2623558 RepID=UPI001567E6EF|nr:MULTISPECIES: sigma-54 dependent transcriptional regulator [unclassified Aliiroseovarius]NRP12470.1 C4-dicarboxylate transport transcriptional regulatory protein DctD [Aliiroseovarius sp. xm-d-517]NRP24844.1 C4-dicarboxylate transport transcriptional regulatory protein DctD [Aliiroseovarius sp. xm-m-379]NRP30521.1 C4-dicarboxylate transport transcriptional regulatory protein DctD [Aliiroseovarius sp. xm-m-314]NRP33643.1 C4-dicarboxylate transport transcriptional regulatory protein DctD [Alii
MTTQVLLVDDDAMVREALGQTLELAGYDAVLAGSYIEAKDHVARDFAGVVVSDIRMPGKDGFQLLDWVQGVDGDLPVILLTGEGDIPMAVRGMTAGAFDFLEKPCDTNVFLSVVERALATRSLILENRALKHSLEKGDAASRLLFGESVLAEELRARVRAVAKMQAEVLICGEPGSGTAKVGEVVHLLSAGAMRPLVKRPAAGLTPEGLAEAYERAEGGTLFLDEIAALDPSTQFALLDLLEKQGQTRVVVGTYRDLATEVAEGRFNPDLFYKLDVLRVRIPAIRERKDDIPVLFRHYVSIASEQAALTPPEISQEVISQLMAQDWPGNARALMNTAMRFAMGLGLGDVEDGEGERPGLAQQLAQVERTLLIEALRRHGGGATAAAKDLKLPRKTFYDKLTRHGIRAEDYRG